MKKSIISIITAIAVVSCSCLQAVAVEKSKKVVTLNVASEQVQEVEIISTTKLTKDDAKKWAKSKNATEQFTNLADLYWKYSSEHGNVNPAIAFVQAAKETGFGNFGGVIDATFCNPCGLKIKDGGANSDPNAHQRFNSWDQGVKAHLDHLAIYAGANGYPRTTTFDPRHFPQIVGTAKSVQALGGKWAPSPAYGNEVVKLLKDLESFQSTSGSNTGSNNSNNNSNSGNNNSNQTSTKKNSWELRGKVYVYYDETGALVKGFKSIGGASYYFDNNGIMQTGWNKIDGLWYYFNSQGDMQTGWKKVNGLWYYFNSKGVMQTGWLNANVKYYLNELGDMQTGWKKIDGLWYYFNSQGDMQTGWKKVDGLWYYFNSKGVMQTGWLNANVKYYLNELGDMQTGWKKIDGSWYYFYEDGSMAKNTIINGYKVDSDGKWTTKKLVVIDPGHNQGGDAGTVSWHNNIKYDETVLDMQVAVKLQEELQSKGYAVVMTRQPLDVLNDYWVTSLKKRYDLANSLKADLFISLHHNSGDLPAQGIETFYSSYKDGLDPTGTDYVDGHDPNGRTGYDVRLAKHPAPEAIKGREFAKNVVNSLSQKAGYINRKEHDRGLNVTRFTNMPSILVELGFISNPTEAVRCADQNDQRLKAKIMADEVTKAF